LKDRALEIGRHAKPPQMRLIDIPQLSKPESIEMIGLMKRGSAGGLVQLFTFRTLKIRSLNKLIRPERQARNDASDWTILNWFIFLTMAV
jgi:hypothetical protein